MQNKNVREVCNKIQTRQFPYKLSDQLKKKKKLNNENNHMKQQVHLHTQEGFSKKENPPKIWLDLKPPSSTISVLSHQTEIYCIDNLAETEADLPWYWKNQYIFMKLQKT